VEFTAFTEDITSLIDGHDVRSHLYADDTQLFASCRSEDINSVRTRLSDCAADIVTWCASRRLQLNASKTEVIWFGLRTNLTKISSRDCTVQIGDEVIQPSAVVRDLGVHLDYELSMKRHISMVAASCFYHLRRLRQIR